MNIMNIEKITIFSQSSFLSGSKHSNKLPFQYIQYLRQVLELGITPLFLWE